MPSNIANKQVGGKCRRNEFIYQTYSTYESAVIDVNAYVKIAASSRICL